MLYEVITCALSSTTCLEESAQSNVSVFSAYSCAESANNNEAQVKYFIGAPLIKMSEWIIGLQRMSPGEIPKTRMLFPAFFYDFARVFVWIFLYKLFDRKFLITFSHEVSQCDRCPVVVFVFCTFKLCRYTIFVDCVTCCTSYRTCILTIWRVLKCLLMCRNIDRSLTVKSRRVKSVSYNFV